MDIKAITDQASTLAGVSIDAAKCRRFINEAMASLANNYDNACSNNIMIIECTDETKEYPLPSNCMGVTRVTIDNYKYNNYIVEDNYIIFDRKGTFTVRYLSLPMLNDRKLYQKELTLDTPGINSVYHVALPFYVAAQVLFIINPNDPKAAAFMSRFNTLCEDANNKIKKGKRKGARIKAPLFR